MSQTNQQWGGRFTESTDAFVQAFTVQFDQRMYRRDIAGLDRARNHARRGRRAERGRPRGDRPPDWKPSAPRSSAASSMVDRARRCAHERRGAPDQRIGLAGKAPAHRPLAQRSGRHRHPPVPARRHRRDPRRTRAPAARAGRTSPSAEADTIMPGFTHLQVAQPVSFGHHLLAWCSNSSSATAAVTATAAHA